jgi:hypothetical protein
MWTEGGGLKSLSRQRNSQQSGPVPMCKPKIPFLIAPARSSSHGDLHRTGSYAYETGIRQERLYIHISTRISQQRMVEVLEESFAL